MTVDAPRRAAFDVLRQVTGEDAYANLALKQRLETAGFGPRDAGFVTELVSGTCRALGTYDEIIERAGGRKLGTLQPAVVDLLRLGAHQALAMDVPARAAVAATVDLARDTVGQRVTGLVNAVLRKIAARTLEQWHEELGAGKDPLTSLAIRHQHPRWIVEAYADVLPAHELEAALAANNVSPVPTLVVRPSLADVAELVAAGAAPTTWSPHGASLAGSPGQVPAVAEGRAGVQDEGSQLVTVALARTPAPGGPWLDLCAGPGGKSALLAGLAREQGTTLVANEVSEHRADLVRQALAAYPDGTATLVTADGRDPRWRTASYARVLADVPCTGLGALRRRPEARWRRKPSDLDRLGELQRDLLHSALEAVMPGGVVAYVTCSPHRAETVAVVEDIVGERGDVELLDAAAALPEVPDAALGRYLQLWPHRHGTDAMFLALLRRS